MPVALPFRYYTCGGSYFPDKLPQLISCVTSETKKPNTSFTAMTTRKLCAQYRSLDINFKGVIPFPDTASAYYGKTKETVLHIPFSLLAAKDVFTSYMYGPCPDHKVGTTGTIYVHVQEVNSWCEENTYDKLRKLLTSRMRKKCFR